MSTTYAGNRALAAALITLPSDGDGPTIKAADVNVALEALADRTAPPTTFTNTMATEQDLGIADRYVLVGTRPDIQTYVLPSDAPIGHRVLFIEVAGTAQVFAVSHPTGENWTTSNRDWLITEGFDRLEFEKVGTALWAGELKRFDQNGPSSLISTTGTHQIQWYDEVVVISASGVTLRMPALPKIGQKHTVTATIAGTVALKDSVGNPIVNNGSTVTSVAQDKNLTLVWNGTTWAASS